MCEPAMQACTAEVDFHDGAREKGMQLINLLSTLLFNYTLLRKGFSLFTNPSGWWWFRKAKGSFSLIFLN